MAEKKLLGLGERKLVGKPTKKKTKAGRTVYKTKEGELVSEKSSTIPIGDKWYNVPSIHAGKKYTEDELKIAIENNRLIPTSVHDNKEEAIDAAKKRSNKLYKGGTPMMNRQMDMFREGGLNQEGGMIDAESGNEVPVGSTREEVRDDIPAKLSEGEFVMPADVVRYHGLDKMMALRDEAKMGLRKMDAMGQMGNSDEATLPEEMPFGMADLIVVAEDGKEVEMAEGGYVTMANGGDPSRNVRQLGATYRPPTSQPIDFTKVMGDGGISFKQYRNANGENLLVSFIGGVPITPIPEGYTEYTPGADEPVTPIQEVVQLSPPTPVANDEDRQRAGYEEGYSIGIENMTPDQLIEENRRRTSIFGKLAGAIAFAINPAAGALYAFGVNRNKGKLLEAAKKNNMTDLASSIEKEKGIGGIVGGVINIVSNLVPDAVKTSKLGQIITKAFNGEGSDPADISEVTEIVKAETGRKIATASRRLDYYDSSPPMTNEPATGRTGVGDQREVGGDEGALSGVPITGGIEPETQSVLTDPRTPMSPTLAAIMGGVNKQRAERADGTLPAGVQVASNLSLASQMRNLGEPSAQSINATAQSIDPRLGYESGQDALNEALVDGRIPLSDYRVDPQTGRYVGPANIPNRVYSPSNMQGPNVPPTISASIPAPTGFGFVEQGRDLNRFSPSVNTTGLIGEGMGERLKKEAADRIPYDASFSREPAVKALPSSSTPYYDAFGNTTVFTGRERDRVDTGIPLGKDAAPGSLFYGDRNTQDEFDAATSAYASNAPRPYNDPGAYTFAAPFGRQDAMGQFPSGPITQASSSIPAPTGFNFVEEERDRVRAGQPIFDQRDTATQKADRLRATPYNASFEREPAVSTNIQPTLANLAESGNVNAAGLNAGIDLSSVQKAARAAELERIIAEAGAKPRPDESMYGAGTENQLEINRRRALEEYNTTKNLYPTYKANNENLLKEKAAYDRLVGSANAGMNYAESRAEQREAMAGAEGTGMTPEEYIRRQQLERDLRSQEAEETFYDPRTAATITDSQLDSGMGGAIQDAQRRRESTLGQMTTPKFDPQSTVGQMTTPKFDPTVSVVDKAKPKTTTKTVNMFGDPVTKGQKGSDEYLFDRTEVAAKEKAYKDKVNSIEFNTRGRDTLLRSGKVVGKNEPMAVYNREQEETGYIGTDAEGYGVGMIAGPGQAGVVVDENGKALKVEGSRKTIYQDSKGQQYTKSTFGKRETLDGKKYTPAEGAKKGDGLDRDNDNEADSGKIICTAMNASYGFGSYRQAIWLSYSNKHLTKEHEVGYHTLFLPLVYLAYTKDIKFIRTLLEHGTRRRTADLRAELKGTKRNTLGRFYRTIFEPLCYTVGKIKIALGN